MKKIKITGRGTAYKRVMVDDVEVSKHISEYEAAEGAQNALAANPSSVVTIIENNIFDVEFV